jgi:hypothetical protein
MLDKSQCLTLLCAHKAITPHTHGKGNTMENIFKELEVFNRYACIGDSITGNHGKYVIRARIESDYCWGNPDNNDEGFWPSKDPKDAGYCTPDIYDAQLQKAQRVMNAFKNNEWFYCGIVLSVLVNVPGEDDCSIEEVLLDNYAASLWGIECNYPDSDNSYLTEVANELCSEAILRADKLLTKLKAV